MNDTGYPLKRHFWRRIAPGLAVLLAVMVAATVFAVIRTTESIYLELARQRAEAVSAAVSHAAPEAWAHLLAHGDTKADHDKLRAAIEQEVRELRIQAMKVYSLTGQVLYSTDTADFAKRETNAALKTVVFDGKPVLVRINENGQPLYEIYVPVIDAAGDIAAVFELYEPVAYLDALLLRSGAIAAAAPAAGLVLLLAGLGILVARGRPRRDPAQAREFRIHERRARPPASSTPTVSVGVFAETVIGCPCGAVPGARPPPRRVRRRIRCGPGRPGR